VALISAPEFILTVVTPCHRVPSDLARFHLFQQELLAPGSGRDI
jgi:hypothetical protein